MSPLLIDLHCHILPGIDDGSVNTDESIAMAKRAVSDGIRAIVATPHALDDVYRNLFQNVIDQVVQLRRVLSKERLPIDLYPGSDARLCADMLEKIFIGEAGTINGNGRYLLVELPTFAIPPAAKNELFQLKLNGISPIITHPERNHFFLNHMEILYDLVTMGCLVQITAMSITGGFGHCAMEYAHELLRCRLAHVIASDAHSATKRPPILSSAVNAAAIILGSKTEADAMVIDRPKAILEGKSLSIPVPKSLGEKKWWKFWN